MNGIMSGVRMRHYGTHPIQQITPYGHYPLREERAMLAEYTALPTRSKRDKSARQAATSVKRWLIAAGEAERAILTMLAASTTAWEERAVYADRDGLEGEADRGAYLQSYALEVQALASGQRNRSYEVVKNAPSLIEPGTHRFTIQSAETQHALDVTIVPGDLNAHALGKLYYALQQLGPAYTAAIREDKQAGTLQLELCAASSGPEHAFAIHDEASGSAISATGLGKIDAPARNARCLVNGAEAETEGNVLSLDGGRVRLSLRQAGETIVTVRVGFDRDAVTRQLAEVAARISELHSLHAALSGHLNPTLQRDIDACIRTYAAERIGLAAEPRQGWVLDEARLHAALEEDAPRVRREMTAAAGWLRMLHQTIERLRQQPAIELMNPAAQALDQYTYFRGTMMQAAWILPSSGWLMNARG
ncbi:hypothetical protein IDH44_18510 [Paenibacillus sp. IB182496]|uniref:Flagellar hook-associated protein 2 C-terminal domain-containing protein n=1 Tax=Paenibacillus sabuli TaxID=2772509 RepID=A0A927BUR3_9BACL|nr:hypothetical protein [Paenibacillus sabuli]MBD2847197.1 hypothetical protein [Paenibacillus sabuli]